jgi:hypothetical protein
MMDDGFVSENARLHSVVLQTWSSIVSSIFF